MTLSIIIVNYNVKYFLEQCLCSIQKAAENIEAEIFIVDNHSSDASLDYLRPKFPFVNFIVNDENVGFSKANNQALIRAKGRYILFLNPDTIIAEDSFEKCIAFLESTPGAGALGVKMVDGLGNYLKESKRGFPSPWVSFCKLFGIANLFPYSKIFAGYYLGHLSENQNQIIDTISGAFFFARKSVLESTGGFDEQFFMYAEDIDLSYRIQKSGYKNYYFCETTIIHFKGESTKKNITYLKQFYKAMTQFVKKYFNRGLSIIFSYFIQMAIAARGLVAVIFNFVTFKKHSKISNKKIFIWGNCTSEVLNFASVKNKTIVKTQFEADEIIFCENTEYSFKKMIETVQSAPKKQGFLFHACNSNSILESNKGEYCGNGFELHP